MCLPTRVHCAIVGPQEPCTTRTPQPMRVIVDISEDCGCALSTFWSFVIRKDGVLSLSTVIPTYLPSFCAEHADGLSMTRRQQSSFPFTNTVETEMTWQALSAQTA